MPQSPSALRTFDSSANVKSLRPQNIKTVSGVDYGSVQKTTLGKLTHGVYCVFLRQAVIDPINAVAQFERDLLIERTQSGLARAKATGKILGRPKTLSDEEHQTARELIARGQSIASIARQLKTSRQTVMRIRDQNA